MNPLTFIDNVNETSKLQGIDKFTDIIAKYSGLGVKQKGALRSAVKQAFDDNRAGEYPTLKQVQDKLTEVYDKADSLTEIVDELCRYNVFAEDTKGSADFLNTNIYLSLSGSMSNSLRFTSLLLVVQYIYNTFMNMSSTAVEDGVRTMRYVMVIDEAHNLFREKKYHEILERMLREIRSKGVSIIMLSQGIDEYNQASFNFSEMCAMSILLDISNKDTKSVCRFLGLGDGSMPKVKSGLEKLAQRGQAISNLRQPGAAEVFKVMQWWERGFAN